MGEPLELNNEVATKVVQDLTTERDKLRDEANRLRAEVAELRRALEASQRQVAMLEEDWQSMFRLLPKELQVTEEDIRAIQRDPHTFEELFREWEQK